MTKKLLSVLLVLTLLLCGCAGQSDQPAPTPAPAEFSAAGMNITLNESFTQKEYVTYTTGFESADIAVFVLLEEAALFDGTDYGTDFSADTYAEMLWKSNGNAGSPELTSAGDLVWFDFDASANGNDYTYRAFVFKSADGYWLVQFAALAENFEALADTMNAYAATITFDNPYVAPTPAATDVPDTTEDGTAY